MAVKIAWLGAGIFGGNELEAMAPRAEWRKATRNMMMATASIERALGPVPGWMDRAGGETGLVLGSSSGELDTSSEFLVTLSKSKMARPLLFQNSLHNATTGFASIHFKLTGPTFTVSSGKRLPLEALDVARSLLTDGICRACLVTLVEGHKLISGMIGESVSEGAATVLLAEKDFATEMGFPQAREFIFGDWSADFEIPPAAAPLVPIAQSQFFRRASEAN